MKIEEIKERGTYYQVFTTYAREYTGAIKTRFVNKVFVLQIDAAGGRVLASLNGAPAQWFKKTKVARWKKENPENKNGTTKI